MFLDNQAANIEEELQRLKTKEIELETVLEQKKELETQLEQVKEWENRLAGFKDAEPEIKELLDLMLKDPQMRHEVLAHLYKYKKKGEVMSSE
jgi:chaperonin cofactor prefoldin